MKKYKSALSIWLFCGLSLLPAVSHGQFFLVSEGNSFVDDQARQKRLGIEVEFKGLTDTQISDLIKKSYPEAQVSGDIASGLTFKTRIGIIKVVIEGQAYKYENDPVKFHEQKARDLIEAPREIVFPPVTYDEILRIDHMINKLKEAGAKGTSPDLAVSLQVNLEMRELTDQHNVKILLDMMRNYLRPEHRSQIDSLMQVPANRTAYILDFSPGFMKKLENPSYSPSPREFYDDFMYRQSFELLGHADAWTAEISDVRARLLAYAGEAAVVPRVMKMNKLRVSSLLLMAFPDDALTKRVIESGWARPMPVVEFREFNNDFKLLSKVRWSLGLARASEQFGAYDHDKLFSDLSGVGTADIKRMRDGLLKGKNHIRYVLQAPEIPLDSESRAWLQRYNKNIVQIQLSPDKVGSIPLVLADGSVVWHRRNIHRATLLGEFNPGLENALMQQALENKLVEALTFNKFVPKSFPETVSLVSIPGAQSNDANSMVQALNSRFPRGWVLKGAWDLSSEKIIITDKTNFTKAIADYENGFEDYKKQVLEKTAGSDPEVIIAYLKKHPGFLGSKILSLLSDKNLLLVQERRQLVEEFRIEIMGGKVLGQGSTIPRYAYLEKNPEPTDPAVIQQAESYAQSVINKLPPEMQVLPYAFDVALTHEGDWVIIETNPGGNSSFLEENPASNRALVRYLKNYKQPTKGLLSGEQQMQWIQQRLAEFGLSGSKMYPGINLGVDSFEDGAYSRIQDRTDLNEMGQNVVRERLTPLNAAPKAGLENRCRAIFAN
jgi:hypothetical protein